MYEENTYDVVLNRMLDRMSDKVDKRVGSIAYDGCAPAAFEIAQAYWELDNALNEGFADTNSREFLEKRARERSVIPEEATHAIVKGTFQPSTLELDVGLRFNLGEFNYFITDKISDGVYRMQCETPGIEPNIALGEVTPIDYVQDLEYGEITEILVMGENEEDTEVFRDRYFEGFDNQAFGGNIADYKQKLHAIDGVGGVKVVRAWNGAGTVKLIIQNSSYGVPSTEFVNDVQTIVDPEQNQGEGLGLAAIGHIVTVEGVTADTINISTTLTYETGVTFADVQASVENVIDDYLAELNEEWENLGNIIVRISQIETRIMGVTGVIDIADTTINDAAINYTVPSSKVAVRGGFNG